MSERETPDLPAASPAREDLLTTFTEHVAAHRAATWEGSFGEYLELVRRSPQVAQLAHARIYQMIADAGSVADPDGTVRHRFFDGEVFGTAEAIEQVVSYYRSAAARLEPRKRILLLMGPPGGGKSTIAALLKRRLEEHTRRDDRGVFAICYPDAAGEPYAGRTCPMHEEPLHAVPASLRASVADSLGVHVEGDLCPLCRYVVDDCLGGDFTQLRVRRVFLSEQRRVGIGTYHPHDRKSMQVEDLVGSINLSTIGEFGAESDPRAYAFDGEFNISNRGVLEMVEMLKCVRADTLVATSSGIMPIGQLLPDLPLGGIATVDLTVAGRAGAEPAGFLSRTGVKDTLTVTTRRGFTVTGSFDHTLQVVDPATGTLVWRHLEDVRPGDHLALAVGGDVWGRDVKLVDARNTAAGCTGARATAACTLPEQMSPELARWLGYLVAEGSTGADGAVEFANTEPDIRADYAALTERLFAVRPRLDDPRRVRFSRRQVVAFLHELGWRPGAADKVIPWAVLRSSRESVSAFLAGYYAGDGTAGLQGRLTFVTASGQLAHQLQVVLANLGVLATRRSVPTSTPGGEVRDYQHVLVTGADADRLAGLMTVFPSRKAELLRTWRGDTARSGRADIIPGAEVHLRTLHAAFVEQCRRRRLRVKDSLGAALYATVREVLAGANRPTRQTVTRAVAAYRAAAPDLQVPRELDRLLAPGVRYDQVTTVVPAGRAECWDVNMPVSHTFVGNGIVNHNCPEEFLYLLLTLTQEQSIKAGRFPFVYADEAIISHTNQAEFDRWMADPKSAALRDRTIVVRVPYNLRLDDEVAIYRKMIAATPVVGSAVHLDPVALRVAATFAVLTRLVDSSREGVDRMRKLRAYNGEDVAGLRSKDVKELREEARHTEEGMRGISPRFVIDAISAGIVRDDGTDGPHCLTAIDTLRALKDALEVHPAISAEDREAYRAFISEARRGYDDMVKVEVQRAFVHSFEDQANSLLNKYLDNVEAFCNAERLRDPVTEEELDPDEALMRSIEEQIAVTDSTSKAFREEILVKIGTYARQGKPFTWASHPRLKEAIEGKLFTDMRDLVRVTVSTLNPDKEQLARLNAVAATLMGSHGYCQVCANGLLRYAGTMLAKA